MTSCPRKATFSNSLQHLHFLRTETHLSFVSCLIRMCVELRLFSNVNNPFDAP
jgi:hypothetical protein